MTNRTRLVCLAGGLVMAGMALFPPWLHHYQYGNVTRTVTVGYAFIGNGVPLPIKRHWDIDGYPIAPSTGYGLSANYWSVRVDITRLLVQELAALVLFAGLALAAGAKRGS